MKNSGDRGPYGGAGSIAGMLFGLLMVVCIAIASPQPPSVGKPHSPQPTVKTATSPAGAKPKPEQQEEKDKVIVENADRLRYDGQRKVYVLEGNVRMKHKDVVLTCDYAEYWEERDEAEARGHLLLRDPESSITGDVVRVDFTDEIALVEGNVVIVTQKRKKGEQEAAASGEEAQAKSGAEAAGPTAGGEATGGGHGDSGGVKQQTTKTQPAGAEAEEEGRPKSIREARERKTTIYCPRVRYRYTEGQRYAWISGPIRAEQKGRQAWADQAEYDDEEGVLKLLGNVRVKTDEGDEFTCPAAVVSVDEEWLRAEKISGVAIRKKKKSEETGQPEATAGQQPAPEETVKTPPAAPPADTQQPPPPPGG